MLITATLPPATVVLAHHRKHRSHGSGYATYYTKGDSNPHLADGTYYGDNGPMFCAAPRSIPLGTVLRIHSPTTGKTIRVVVRDRCPDHVDLSRGAFQRIGGRGGHVAIETHVESRGKGRVSSSKKHHRSRKRH